jgi:hypothetical protein
MSNDAPKIVLAKWMEGIFRHGDVAYATKCLITTEKHSNNNHQYHTNIHTLLRRHDRVFGKIPQGDHSTEDLSTLLNWKRDPNL